MKTQGSDQAFTNKEYSLTKREYFAAMALNGILSDPNITLGPLTAAAAVRAADYLIAALNEPQTEAK